MFGEIKNTKLESYQEEKKNSHTYEYIIMY